MAKSLSDAEFVAEVARAAAGALTLDVVLRVVAEGLELRGLAPGRVNLAVLTVHPALAGIGFAWSRARIISARWASRTERALYVECMEKDT